MKTRRILLLFASVLCCAFIIGVACGKTTGEHQEELHSDEIHMQYNADGFYVPILDITKVLMVQLKQMSALSQCHIYLRI